MLTFGVVGYIDLLCLFTVLYLVFVFTQHIFYYLLFIIVFFSLVLHIEVHFLVIGLTFTANQIIIEWFILFFEDARHTHHGLIKLYVRYHGGVVD